MIGVQARTWKIGRADPTAEPVSVYFLGLVSKFGSKPRHVEYLNYIICILYTILSFFSCTMSQLKCTSRLVCNQTRILDKILIDSFNL